MEHELLTLPHYKDIDTRWVQVKFSHCFSPRSFFASCIQAGNIYVHGGFSAETGIMKDMYSCCLYELPAQWKSLEAKNHKTCNPGSLRSHTLNSYLSNLILIGGQKNVIENNSQIYKYDLLGNTWTICKCVDQKGQKFNWALDSHNTIQYKNSLYVLGGYNSNTSQYFSDIIKISLEKISQNLLIYEVIKGTDGPSPRGNSSCCLSGQNIYIFGGGNVEDVFGDFWTFDLEERKWVQLVKIMEETIAWPQKRKGGTMVLHEKSNTIFLFGGIKKITKEQNDVMVYMISKKKWIKIHSSTNQLYEPSPTLKYLDESPTIAQEKRKREKNRVHTNGTSPAGSFKLGMKTVAQSDGHRMHETNIEFMKRQSSYNQHPQQFTQVDFKKKMSVVQEKKYRQFLNRKKKLLSNIQSGAQHVQSNKKRSHSPTSQALIFSINCMGEQPKNEKNQMNLPKVIYDEQKGQVIGKKPCARDGHAALLHEQCMLILGGDRHMVSFNDAYLFKLKKGVQSLPHYE